jgi:hypothetical protein
VKVLALDGQTGTVIFFRLWVEILLAVCHVSFY